MNIINEILDKIKNNFDNEIYLVGGAVRDFYLGKGESIDDFDLLVVDECAQSFAKKVEELLDGTFVPLDEENKIYRIAKDGVTVDVTNPIEDSLTKDLMRRDLTLNAVAVNLKTGAIIDPCKGLEDIKNKIIRHVSEQNFLDDPLRLLRVYRFQAVTGFKISPETAEIVVKHKSLIAKPAKERVAYELMKLFNGEYATEALRGADESGLLAEFLPFVEELKKIPSNPHHHLRLFEHSVETVKQIQQLYENARPEVKEQLDKSDFGGFSRLAHLKLVGFMHDIGKFATWTIEEEGRHRFIKHDDVGAKIAAEFLKKMKFSKKQIAYIADMVKNHIYPAQLMSDPEVSEKTMIRFVRKLNDNAIDVVVLAKADRLSARGEVITDEIVARNNAALDRLIDFYIEKGKAAAELPKLLSGTEIMEILNIKPSPRLGTIIGELHESQMSGEVNSKPEAIEFVKMLNNSLQ